jgi:hypothetical protein
VQRSVGGPSRRWHDLSGTQCLYRLQTGSRSLWLHSPAQTCRPATFHAGNNQERRLDLNDANMLTPDSEFHAGTRRRLAAQKFEAAATTF